MTVKVSSMKGVAKGKKYIIIGGNSKGFAKALKNKGFGKVFVLKGGYGRGETPVYRKFITKNTTARAAAQQQQQQRRT